MIRFTLDGREAEAEEGELLLDALRRNGADVPTLCHDERLDEYGGCRLCLVGVEGQPRPVPACATRAAEGMAVSTNGDLTGFRGTIVEMLAAEHDQARGGRPDELVDRADDLGAEAWLGLPERRGPHVDVTDAIGLDPDACILCTRCVRYAQEISQCFALGLEGRGAGARVVPTAGRSFLDTECELCGGCIAVCPTGALYEKRAIDAPPERALRQVRTTCTYCGVGCQLDLNVDAASGRIVKVTSRPEYLPNRGDLCVKGRFAIGFVHSDDRLRQPLVRGEDGELHPASWDDALAAAAAGLRGVQQRHGKGSVAVLSSARLTVEENYLVEKLARTALGVNSVHSCEGT